MMPRMISHLVPHVRVLPGVPVAVLVIPNDVPIAYGCESFALSRPSRPSAIEVKYRERIVLVASAYRQQTSRQQTRRMVCPTVLLAQVHAVAHPCTSTR